ncbi:MAG: hypothetical protein WDM77_06315 [Steroidobacteraceae bacterium]
MARAASGTAGEARDLARMRRRLVEWRESHARGGSVSQRAVVGGGASGSATRVHVTARALGWNTTNLNGPSGGVIVEGRSEARQPPKATRMKFIEVTGMVPASPCGCRVWLQGPDGQRLQWEMAPSAATEMVLQLCRSGWGASR